MMKQHKLSKEEQMFKKFKKIFYWSLSDNVREIVWGSVDHSVSESIRRHVDQDFIGNIYGRIWNKIYLNR